MHVDACWYLRNRKKKYLVTSELWKSHGGVKITRTIEQLNKNIYLQLFIKF